MKANAQEHLSISSHESFRTCFKQLVGVWELPRATSAVFWHLTTHEVNLASPQTLQPAVQSKATVTEILIVAVRVRKKPEWVLCVLFEFELTLVSYHEPYLKSTSSCSHKQEHLPLRARKKHESSGLCYILLEGMEVHSVIEEGLTRLNNPRLTWAFSRFDVWWL